MSVTYTATDGVYLFATENGAWLSRGAGSSSGQINTLLDGAINDSVTTITVDTTFAFNSPITIGNESITFTGQTATTFTGCVRGANNSIAAAQSDNAVVRAQSEADLSSNSNGLAVVGTVILTAVAALADTRDYSAFTASVFMYQPYNSDLDHGTSDFAYCFWLKMPATAVYETVFERGYYSGGFSGSQIRVAVINTTSVLEFFISDDGFSTNDSIQTSTAIDDDIWRFYVVQRVGSVIQLWVDSVKAAADVTVTNASGSLSNTNGSLRVGLNHNDGDPLTNGNIASLKNFTGNLSLANINTLYESERELYKPDSTYQVVDALISLDIPLSAISHGQQTQRKRSISLGGQSETLRQRNEQLWNWTTTLLVKTALKNVRTFLRSVSDGQTFQFDLYGTIAVPDIVLNVEIESTSYTESLESQVPYYRISGQVKEV